MEPKPLTLAFSTFLKICTRKTRGKIGEVRRFTQAGGYDFYKKMKQIAGRLAKNEISLDQARALAKAITVPAEQAHTLAAIEKVAAILDAWKLQACDPPEGAFVSSSGLLTVKLRPDLAFLEPSGLVRCVYLWNLASPALTQPLAGEGLWLSRNHVGGDQNSFGILDLRKNYFINEKAVTAASGAQVLLDLMRVEEIWKDIHNPALTADETIAHVSALTLPASP